MNGKTSVHKSNNAAAPSVIFLLFGVLVCCQMVSHIYQWNALSRDEGSLVGFGADSSCGSGLAGASSNCMEAQLFKGWSELPNERPEDLEKLLAPSQNNASDQATAAPASTSPKPSFGQFLSTLEDALESIDTTHGKAHSSTGTVQATVSMRGTVTASSGHFKESLSSLQDRLESKRQSHAKLHAQHRALRALAHVTHDSTVWTPDAKPVAVADDGMTAWAHGVDDMTHDLEKHMLERQKAKAEHAAQRAAHVAELKAAGKPHASPLEAWSSSGHAAQPAAHPLLDEIQSLGQQLCDDPWRRDRPSCAQFKHSDRTTSAAGYSHEQQKDRHETAMAHMKLLEKHLDEIHEQEHHDTEEIKEESLGFLRNLCADPERHSYPACKRFLTTPKPSFLAPSTTAAETRRHAGTMEMIVHKHELRHFKWEGEIPKVACITVLPRGHVSETLMQYFIDNWNLQHYEGSRVLVIVYHGADHEGERIAKLHADGISVVAAAARGEGDDFPSATAFRYGAWVAQSWGLHAELFARWDFDAWHHPHRLSMQVRAIYLSQRPVSVTSKVTAFDANGTRFTMPGGTGPRGSIIGKASWIHKHWMPYLEDERSMVSGLHAHHFVQVAMPELLAYHDVAAPGVAAAAAAA